ncbi:M56 family metallopeptidase [Maribellus sp. CM-23]|uniref:M56 family metallopeptidase n=1 Tax=Maribellus sp. CM-23 TaxID=2781026 RepID=UPI001F37975D|nr:M56 family metallopeptidase [Maribellus sp. CM-23]MCE4563240.1 M56 family metallopeptidase [Maribellus sp. CM-23]
MNPFLVWLLKSSVSLALLYAVFKLAVSRDKMHTANRMVLLGILLTSVVLPFADVPVFRETQVIPQFEAIHEWVAAPVVNEPVVYAEDTPKTMSEATPVKAPINPWLVFYLGVIGMLVGRLAFSVARVWQIIRRAEKQHFRDVVLAIVKDFIQPFSFLQHIVLSEKDFTENRDIVIAHEYAHIQHKHALDLMICELFTALFWFNPVVWLLRRDLKLIHEYQADQAVLNQGIDAKTYQLLVLKKAVGERRFALANHFSQKPILKRIKMMHMKKETGKAFLKLLLFVPAIMLLLISFKEESNSIQIDGRSYPIEKVVVANESPKESGKFEINIYPKDDKNFFLGLISFRTNSKEKPDEGTYKYIAKSYSEREAYTFFGSLFSEGDEVDITQATFQMLESNNNKMKFTFEGKLKDGQRFQGSFFGQVEAVDYRYIHK